MNSSFYVLGLVKGKSKPFSDERYGTCTHLYLSVLKTDHPELKGLIDCSCWNENSNFANRLLYRKALVMIEFSKFKNGYYNGQQRQRILAKTMSMSNWREYEILMKDRYE